jgi:electron transfer flavoprotein alpha subunit
MNLRLIALLAAFFSGLLLSAFVVNDIKNADIAALKAAHAQQQAAAEAAARQRLEEATARGDDLAARLAKTETALNQKTLEVSREIARVTTGRPCLGAAAVRLLNNPRDDIVAVPQTASQPDAEDGAVATDTDIANWIANAQGQYETCRARLGALIDWWGPEHD